jgi:hypothetical protein
MARETLAHQGRVDVKNQVDTGGIEDGHALVVVQIGLIIE